MWSAVLVGGGGNGGDGTDDVGYLLVLYGLPFYVFGDFVRDAEFVLVGCYADVDCLVLFWDENFSCYTGDVVP